MNGFDSSTSSASSLQENILRLARCIEAESSYKTSERGRSPVQIPCLFVSKLYEMLGDCELDKEKGKIVSWLPDGKSFRVHKPKEVIKDILPTYSNQVRNDPVSAEHTGGVTYSIRRLTSIFSFDPI